MTASRYNFQFRLLLTRLYAHLGAFQSCLRHFDQLEIKYIQHDTLSHYWLTHAASLGHFSRATLLHNQALKFFSATFRDTSEYLIHAYRFGSFAQIPEFLRLRDRLTHSLQYSLVYIDSLIFDLIMEVDSHAQSERRVAAMALDPVLDQTNWELIHDNRDVLLMSDWSAATLEAQTERQNRHRGHEVAWTQLRHVTHHAVSAVVAYAAREEAGAAAPAAEADPLPPPPATQPKTPVDAAILGRLLSDFRHHVTDLRRRFLDDDEDERRLPLLHPLYASPPSRLFDYLRFAWPIDILLLAFDLVQYVFSLSQAFAAADKTIPKDAVNEKMEALLKSGLVDAFRHMFEACVGSTLATATPTATPTAATDATEATMATTTTLPHHRYLHHFSAALETLALVAPLLGSCHQTLRQLKNSLTKKSRKKKGGGGEAATIETFAHFTAATSALKEAAAEFGRRIGGMGQQLALSEVCLGMQRLGVSEDADSDAAAASTSDDVLTEINESYATAAAEMEALVEKKVRYLTSLTKW